MKKIFVHDIEIFDLELLVCVGVRRKDILSWAKKNSEPTKKIFEDKIMDDFDDFTKNSGFVKIYEDNNGVFFYILWLKEWENSWDSLDILNHEITHLRQFSFEHKNIENEIEFEAYFQENVFRTLRQRLNKFLK